MVDFDDENMNQENQNEKQDKGSEKQGNLEVGKEEASGVEEVSRASVVNNVSEIAEKNLISLDKSMASVSKKASKVVIHREETCLTSVRVVVVRNGKQLKWQDYASLKSKGLITQDEDVSLIDLYAWPDTSLEELGYLIANKIPSFVPSPSLKFTFKAVHVDRLVQQELERSNSNSLKSSISDLGFIFLNKQSSTHSSTLFQSKYSLGDILEVSLMSRGDIGIGKSRGDIGDIGKKSGRFDLRSAIKNSSTRFAPYNTSSRRK